MVKKKMYIGRTLESGLLKGLIRPVILFKLLKVVFIPNRVEINFYLNILNSPEYRPYEYIKLTSH